MATNIGEESGESRRSALTRALSLMPVMRSWALAIGLSFQLHHRARQAWTVARLGLDRRLGGLWRALAD
jgi:hypothetical protein